MSALLPSVPLAFSKHVFQNLEEVFFFFLIKPASANMDRELQP